ncbi:hypothetical protein [Argonema galeatum]|nr:hypothetical protein [Argonema galeatum]MCL1464151.1 hypothetical protein [Argonema galeatum A003/A1]
MSTAHAIAYLNARACAFGSAISLSQKACLLMLASSTRSGSAIAYSTLC